MVQGNRVGRGKWCGWRDERDACCVRGGGVMCMGRGYIKKCGGLCENRVVCVWKERAGVEVCGGGRWCGVVYGKEGAAGCGGVCV